MVEFSKKRNTVKADKEGLIGDAKLVKIEGAGMELKDYQTVNFKGQDLILDLMASGVHCVVTARETDEKETIKGDDGKTMSVNTGKKIPDGFKGMGYNVKTVIRTFRESDTGVVMAHIQKDRTHTYKDNEFVEDPTLLAFQSVIDKTADKKSFVLKNDLTKAVSVEQDIYKKEILGEVGSPKQETTSQTVDTKSNEAELKVLKAEIKKATTKMSPPQKETMKAKIKENNLPLKYNDMTDVDALKKYLSIVTE